ncbi:aminotransferase-like domain-containing protein [Chitinimonas sp. JJ19]|uniref:aminotransferase-like domain-containing protein n=1 Tax=Chitinimonas sp. JJ19 TaxID=3109352 RepID=UPI001A5A200C|nr:PLP-dependent aminotransferase family protein [Chitinimonas sp.]
MTTRYQTLADDLANRIHAGVLQPGSRVPSVRQLCTLHTVSPATVTHALHLLEDAGLIEARPRLGFFVRQHSRRFAPPSQCAEPALPTAIQLEGHRKLVIEFTDEVAHPWLGMSAIADELFPLAQVKKLLVQQLQRDPQILNRASYGGEPSLREQLARRSLILGCNFQPDEIIVTHGDTEATDLCLRLLTRPGDLVAIQTPGPLRVLEMLEGLGLHALEIPAHPCDGLSVDALAHALQHNKPAACIINANFPSPTGSRMPESEKARLVELAQRHAMPLIEVDTFGDLNHGEQRPRPIKAYDRHDNVLYCGELSTLVSPGLGIGYIAAGRHRLTLAASQVVHGEPVPALIQHTMAALLSGGQFEPHMRRLRSRLASQMQAYRKMVIEHFPGGTRMACGDGGFMLWLELPDNLDAAELQRRVLATGHTFAPGALFSLGSSFANCLRLNAGYPLSCQIEEGIRIIGRLAHAMQAEQHGEKTLNRL